MRLTNLAAWVWVASTLISWVNAAKVPAEQVEWRGSVRARYLVLTAKDQVKPPFAAVDIVRGPRETINGAKCCWWQLEARAEAAQSTPPLFIARGLTVEDPLEPSRGALQFQRYMLRVPETGEAWEYRDVHTGRALVPAWDKFDFYFVPRRGLGSALRQGMPETCEYLGHILTLINAGPETEWPEWKDAKVLDLDRELLVGTSRNFKDQEGHRLPQKPERRNYTYIPFGETDYRTMIDAGINLFTVQPNQEPWVRGEPVFYLRPPGGKPPLRYPADLYRANYIGPVMFMDEPSILMVGDPHVHNTLRFFSDAANLIRLRTQVTYSGAGSYGSFALEKGLQDQGINLGAMRLRQVDYPSWETYYDTVFYQYAGGAPGVVHEGRYQLDAFDREAAKWTGSARQHTAREMLRYHYAFLRGAARHFGKNWGMSIYGQADPAISPEAVTLAYDMGARYVWFWTSDHDHHVPWPEQLALARTLQEHVRKHPRPSLTGKTAPVDTLILIPYGYFLSLENLWWVRVMDKEGKNEAAQQNRRLMQRAWEVVHQCFRRKADFDICIDDGQPVKGYRRVVRIQDRP